MLCAGTWTGYEHWKLRKVEDERATAADYSLTLTKMADESAGILAYSGVRVLKLGINAGTARTRLTHSIHIPYTTHLPTTAVGVAAAPLL